MTEVLRAIADYAVVRDASFTLGVGADIDRTFDFELPRDVRTDTAAVLSLVLNRVSATTQLRIDINEATVYDTQPGSGVGRCIQEVVPPVLVDGANQLAFTVATGEVVLSDVVLWYKRDRIVEDTTVRGYWRGWPWNW